MAVNDAKKREQLRYVQPLNVPAALKISAARQVFLPGKREAKIAIRLQLSAEQRRNSELVCSLEQAGRALSVRSCPIAAEQYQWEIPLAQLPDGFYDLNVKVISKGKVFAVAVLPVNCRVPASALVPTSSAGIDKIPDCQRRLRCLLRIDMLTPSSGSVV